MLRCDIFEPQRNTKEHKEKKCVRIFPLWNEASHKEHSIHRKFYVSFAITPALCALCVIHSRTK
jgi:hypothetical protein